MKSVSELLILSAEFLKSKNIENPRRAAEELIADAMHTNRLELYLSYDRPVENHEVEEIRKRLKRRAGGEPWQYITGEVQFFNCNIKVNPFVLIPRQETEILVDNIVKEISSHSREGKKLLDLCSGSGCIGIALKKRFPELSVSLADISQDALELAAENAKANSVEVDLFQGNFLEAVSNKKFDYVVSNPPYVSEQEYNELHFSVKNFEPKLALLARDGGVEFYKRFAESGQNYLNSGAKVWFEMGCSQGPALFELFKNSIWKCVKIEKDWSGKDRFFSLEIE